MGKGGGSTTTSTTSNSVPPEVLAQYQNLITQANTQAAQPLQQYQGNTVAPLTAYQNQAGTEVANLQGATQPLYNQAQGLINSASQQITPQTVNAADIQQYESPYMQQVLNSTTALENQQDAQQQSQLEGNAAAQGAWGGDRSAVAQGILAGQQDLANNSTNAGILNQGYSQALGEANTQQQAGLSAQEASQYLGQQGGAALTNLANQELSAGLTGASALNSAGEQQQQETQEELNVPYENFLQQQAFPYQNLSWLSSLSTGLGNSEGGTSTSSTTQPAPNSIFGFARGGHIDGLIKRIASGGAVMMPPHYDKGGSIPRFDSGGGLIPGQGFNLTPTSSATPPNLDTSVFSGLPMTLTKGSNLPDAKATPQQQQNPLHEAAQTAADLGGLYTAGKGISSALPSIGGIGGETESISPALAAADPDLVASGAGTTGLFSSIGPALESIGSSLGSLFSFLGPAAPVVAANRGGAIRGYSNGGLIRHYDDGGLVPSDTSTNPMVNNTSAKLAQMSTQQLQQVMQQYPQIRPIAQRVLQQKQMMPNVGAAPSNAAPMAPSAPQAGMARGGLIKRYDDGGGTDMPSSALVADDPDLAPDGGSTPLPASLPTLAAQNNTPVSPENVAKLQELYGNNDDTTPISPASGLVAPSSSAPASGGLTQSPDANGFAPVPIPTFHDDKPINQVNPWLSVAAGVAGALAGKSPYVLQNLAGGVLTGLESYGAQQKEAADEVYKNGTIQDARDKLVSDAYQHNADAQKDAKEYQQKLELEQQKADEQAKYQQGELANQAAERQKPELVKDMMGVPIGWATPGSNKITPLTGMPDMGTGTLPVTGSTGNAQAPATGIGSGSAGQRLNSKLMTSPAPDADIDAYLAKYPPAVATHAEMLASGEEQWPSGIATKNPVLYQAATVAKEINPNITQAAYPTFLNFANGQKGNIARSLNVATAHLDTLDDLTTALDNGDTKAINSLSNTFKSQFGVAAPTNFDTAKQIVADEVTKAVIGAGGTGADREQAAKVINAANSPEQLHQAISTYKTLMAGQLQGLQQQYEGATGRNDFQSRILTAQARTALGNQQPSAAGNGTQTVSSLPTATGPNGQKLQLVNGKWTPLTQ